MTSQNNLTSNPRATLFDALDGARAGMLGLRVSKAGSQPMTHFADSDSGLIWFISANDTDLARGLLTDTEAEYVVISRDHDVHASMQGTLSQVQDDAKLDELWSPWVGAWFRDGRSDARVALLRFEPKFAEIWTSTTSTLKFGFEMVRANLAEDHQPDVGSHHVVRFDTAD